MGIQRDAGELLVFIYNAYIQEKEISFQIRLSQLLEKTGWEPNRINRAFEYLEDVDTIKVWGAGGNTNGVYNHIIHGLTPIGIGAIENEKEFQKYFNFEVGIPGIFKYSWGAQEK